MVSITVERSQLFTPRRGLMLFRSLEAPIVLVVASDDFRQRAKAPPAPWTPSPSAAMAPAHARCVHATALWKPKEGEDEA